MTGNLISEAEVRRILNTIDDPCSVAAGCRAGLGDMGLIKQVQITPDGQGAHVRILLGTTDVGCMMVGMFVNESRERLQVQPGVSNVDVEIDYDLGWTEEQMEPSYRERLKESRAKMRERLFGASAPN